MNVSSLLPSVWKYYLRQTWLSLFVPSVLWRCWLGGRKGIQPAKKTEWWVAGMVICLEWRADVHMAQLMPLPLTVCCFSKIQIGFTFLVLAHLGSPGKRAVKQLCVYDCKLNLLSVYILTARCYASAVLATALCLSVRLSVCLSVCLSQVGVLLKRLNVGSHKQHHTIRQRL